MQSHYLQYDRSGDIDTKGDHEKVRGFFFTVFHLLRIIFRILKPLKYNNLLGKMSLNEIISELSKMKRII